MSHSPRDPLDEPYAPRSAAPRSSGSAPPSSSWSATAPRVEDDTGASAGQLESPARVAWVWTSAFGLVVAAFFVLGVWISVTALDVSLARASAVVATVGASALATGAIAAGSRFARILPLHRGLERRTRQGADAPPPSLAAIVDAFGAPRAIVAAAAFGGLVAVVVQAAQAAFARDPSADEDVTLGVIAFGAGAAVLPTLGIVLRRATWTWLSRVDPEDVTVTPRASLEPRLAMQLTLPVAALVLAVFSVVLAHRAPTAAPRGVETMILFATSLSVVVVAGTAYLGRALARATTRDLAVLRARLAHLRTHEPPQPKPSVRTRAGRVLASGISRLESTSAELEGDERDAARAAEEARVLRSRFMAYMSHDLKSPLNSILGFSSMLAKSANLNAQQRESLELVRIAGEELLGLVTDVLDAARLEAGKLALHRSWEPPVELVTSAAQRVTRIAEGVGAAVEAEVAPGLPPVFVDGVRILQACVALARHMLRAIPSGGTIRILARPDLTDVNAIVIEVQRFARSRPSSPGAFRSLPPPDPEGPTAGSVLALSLAEALVGAHGGTVEVRRSRSELACLLSLPRGPASDGRSHRVAARSSDPASRADDDV